MSKNAFYSHLKSADFETFCDWSTSSWRNNLDTPWCNNLVCNNLDDVVTLWCDVKIVTPQGHVLFTAFGKLMFEHIFWYEVNQWFLNDIVQKFWKIMGFQNMINSHDVQLVNCKSFYYTKQFSLPCHVSAAHSRCPKYPPAAATHSSARRRVCQTSLSFFRIWQPIFWTIFSWAHPLVYLGKIWGGMPSSSS